MKSILMSIRPKWVCKILNGEKTIEIRKRFPSDYVGWVYIYCTKDKKYANLINRGGFLTGMVVARFWCDKVEEIKWHKDTAIDLDYYKVVNVIENEEILKASCLQLKELEDYLQIKNAKNIPTTWGITFNLGKAIHITKLDPFDKPKEIKEFYTTNLDKDLIKLFDNSIQLPNGTWVKPLTRAPESWQYIEV